MKNVVFDFLLVFSIFVCKFLVPTAILTHLQYRNEHAALSKTDW